MADGTLQNAGPSDPEHQSFGDLSTSGRVDDSEVAHSAANAASADMNQALYHEDVAQTSREGREIHLKNNNIGGVTAADRISSENSAKAKQAREDAENKMNEVIRKESKPSDVKPPEY